MNADISSREQQLGAQVLGEAADAQGMLDWIKVACPDLMLLDWELPGLDALERKNKMLRRILGWMAIASIVRGHLLMVVEHGETENGRAHHDPPAPALSAPGSPGTIARSPSCRDPFSCGAWPVTSVTTSTSSGRCQACRICHISQFLTGQSLAVSSF